MQKYFITKKFKNDLKSLFDIQNKKASGNNKIFSNNFHP